MGWLERDRCWCRYSTEAVMLCVHPWWLFQRAVRLPPLACHQAGDLWGVAPMGPSCHRCASAVLAEVPAPARSELCQQMSCCQSLRRSQLKAPPPPKHPSEAEAARSSGQTCHRPLWATPGGRVSAGIKDGRGAAALEVESRRKFDWEWAELQEMCRWVGHSVDKVTRHKPHGEKHWRM